MNRIINKKIVLVFTLAFGFNWIWENLHSNLYMHYKSGEITRFILARATLFDAVFITLLGILFLNVAYLRKRPWYAFVFGITAAIVIEWHALGTSRWMYKDIMPVIPLIKTGLTPTIQLGFLSFVVFKMTRLLNLYPREDAPKTAGEIIPTIE